MKHCLTKEDINLAKAIARKRNKIIYNEDTLSCAYEGLVKAANTYKSNKGCKFSSIVGMIESYPLAAISILSEKRRPKPPKK